MLIFRKPKLTVFGSCRYIILAWGLLFKRSSDGGAEEDKQGKEGTGFQMLNGCIRGLTYQNTNAQLNGNAR